MCESTTKEQSQKNLFKITEEIVEKAVQRGDFNIVKYLIEKDGPISLHAVHLSIRNNNLKILKYLIEKGGWFFYSAILSAIEFGSIEMIRYIIEKIEKK